jgi:hydrogenase maturation protease
MNRDILILGIGNDILKDDGVGIKVVERFRNDDTFKGVDYKTLSLGGLDILEIIQNYTKVFIVDGIKTKDGKPGNIYYFETSDFKETLHLSNIHDISFLNAIKLGKKLGFKIPEEIHVFAVEILEDRVFGDEFTPELKNNFNRITIDIRKEISNILTQTIQDR